MKIRRNILKPSLMERIDSLDLLLPPPKGCIMIGDVLINYEIDKFDAKYFSSFLKSIDKEYWYLAIDLIKKGFTYEILHEKFGISKKIIERVLWEWDKFQQIPIDEARYESLLIKKVKLDEVKVDESNDERFQKAYKKVRKTRSDKGVAKDQVVKNKRKRRTKLQMENAKRQKTVKKK